MPPEAIIVVPCYNEARRLPVGRILDYLAGPDSARLLFVDDGSRDHTWRILEDLRAAAPERCDVLRLSTNRGKAEAVRVGILQAAQSNPRFVGFWDADLSTPLDAIEDLCRLARARPQVEMVFGSRVKLLGRVVERRALRHYLGRVFATAVSIVLSLAIYDTQCGAKLFRMGPDILALFERPFLARWIFDVEILARYIEASRRRGLPPAEQVVYEFVLREWRHVGGSKVRPADFVRAIGELWTIGRTYLWR